MIDDCTALILAGGLSSRMGQDKTRLVFDGKSLLQRTVDTMSALFPAVIVCVQALRDDIDAPQVMDAIPGLGPLAGICSGMAEVKTTWVFAVAADMPFIGESLIRYLAMQRQTDCQAVVPVIDAFPQPLTAFYHRSALPAFQSVLESTPQRRVRDVLDRLRVCRVDEGGLASADPGLRGFIDLDTPEDLARCSIVPE